MTRICGACDGLVETGYIPPHYGPRVGYDGAYVDRKYAFSDDKGVGTFLGAFITALRSPVSATPGWCNCARLIVTLSGAGARDRRRAGD